MKISTSIAVLLMSFGLFAQREYSINRTDQAPVIDGVLNDSCWMNTEVASDFTVKEPVYGGSTRFKSEVRLVYDDDALYISGKLFDPAPDSVSFSLSSRDDEGNADWFGLSIDTYGNNVTSFDFMVTSAGVELDALEEVSSIDFSWNAVWKSATKRTEYGWSVEIKIPYSAIRFPNKDVQQWNVNFWRSVRRNRQVSTWNPVDPNIFGEITQSGKLLGIEHIKPPVRLAFIPYTTGYAENFYDEVSQQQTWRSRFTYGMDLKYGLNDAFTLDMSLIPDFGQTTSDKQVLNLGPFEVRFDENRPFFLEGTDLFNIGGLFYSRRVAAMPYDFSAPYRELDESKGETVIDNPELAPMLNGTKISGRTKQGLGIGVFNAVENRTFATIEDSLGNKRQIQTNPLTNYNVFVLSQNLQNNSTVSFVNTNVMREGNARDANVTMLAANLYTPNGKFQVSSQLKLSNIFDEDKYSFGHSAYSFIGKVAGKWRYGFSYGETSDTYNPNDLGFIYVNNSREYNASLSWNVFKKGKHFYRKSINLYVSYWELYKPQLFSGLSITGRIGGLHKKILYTYFEVDYKPVGSVSHFESRQFGKEVLFNPSVSLNYMFSSDYSKRFALDGFFTYQNFFATQQNNGSISLSPRVRVSDRWNIVLRSALEMFTDDYGYVHPYDEAYTEQILLGIRDRKIVENSITTEFIFTKRMGIDLRLRHYWQEVRYKHFNELYDEGRVELSSYNPLDDNGNSLHNTSYNAFTVDINYRWVFIPGSELRIVYKNNIFHSKSDLDVSYFSTFDRLFEQPQINSISMKLLVYVDVLYFKRKHKKRPQN